MASSSWKHTLNFELVQFKVHNLHVFCQVCSFSPYVAVSFFFFFLNYCHRATETLRQSSSSCPVYPRQLSLKLADSLKSLFKSVCNPWLKFMKAGLSTFGLRHNPALPGCPAAAGRRRRRRCCAQLVTFALTVFFIILICLHSNLKC